MEHDQFSHHGIEPRKMGMGVEALKAVVARVKKKLYSSINATHPLLVHLLHVVLPYHRLPVVRFQVVVLQCRGFMLESRG
jgi:hypothetical protein